MKKENIRLKRQIIAYVMSVVIAISPLLMLFMRKNNNKEDKQRNITQSTEPTTTERKTYSELIDEIVSNSNIDFNEITLPTPNDKCTYIKDTINSDNLYNKTMEIISVIKNNSINYSTNNKDYIAGFIIDDDDGHNQDKLMVQSIFKDAISDILINSTSKDLCVLKDLKVVISYYSEFNNCIEYKKEDNLIIIYPNSNWEEIKYAIRLELNKIRIDNCNCQDSPLFSYSTLNNASVISELYNTNKTDVFVSNDDIKKEALFLSLGLFHNNYTINDYYKAIFNNDIETLYKFCNANNEEDIYKINRILYAMNHNIDSLDYDYKTEIFGIIINNLINYTTNNKNFTLKDNLTIFNALRNLINNDSSENIEELSNIYINFLSKHYKETTTTIINTLNDKKITDYTIALYNVCHEHNDGNIEIQYLNHANEILKRFPLLKQILILYTYQEYNNNLSNPFILSKVRNN